MAVEEPFQNLRRNKQRSGNAYYSAQILKWCFMIDYVRTETAMNLLSSIDFYSGQSFEWLGVWFNPAYHKKGKGVVKRYEGEIRGLSVYVYPDKIRLSNSLHKFSKGKTIRISHSLK